MGCCCRHGRLEVAHSKRVHAGTSAPGVLLSRARRAICRCRRGLSRDSATSLLARRALPRRRSLLLVLALGDCAVRQAEISRHALSPSSQPRKLTVSRIRHSAALEPSRCGQPAILEVAAERLLALDRLEQRLEVALAEA